MAGLGPVYVRNAPPTASIILFQCALAVRKGVDEQFLRPQRAAGGFADCRDDFLRHGVDFRIGQRAVLRLQANGDGERFLPSGTPVPSYTSNTSTRSMRLRSALRALFTMSSAVTLASTTKAKSRSTAGNGEGWNNGRARLFAFDSGMASRKISNAETGALRSNTASTLGCNSPKYASTFGPSARVPQRPG